MGAIKSKLRRTKSASRKGNEKGFKEEKRGSKKEKRPSKLPESPSARRTVDPRLPFSNYRQIFSIRNAWKAISRTLEECAKENLIRFFKDHPGYMERFADIKHLKDDEEMRTDDDFEIIAVDMYQLFDDVITNLEIVDKALRDIQIAANSTRFTRRMLKEFEPSFIETIRIYLGSDRFTETTENNMRLLYGFVRDELGSYLTEVEVNDPGDTADINNEQSEAVDADKDADADREVNTPVNTPVNSELDNEHHPSDSEKTCNPDNVNSDNVNSDNVNSDNTKDVTVDNEETNNIEIRRC